MASSPDLARTDLSLAPSISPVTAMAGTLAVPLAGYVVLVVGALLGRPVILLVGAVLTVIGETLLRRRTPFVGWALASSGLGPILRTALRGLLAVALLARCGADATLVALAVLGWIALLALAAAARTAADVTGWLRTCPVLSRNLDLGPLAVPREPTVLLALVSWLPLVDLALLVGTGLAARSDAGRHGWLIAGLIVTLVPAVGVVGALAAALRSLRAASPRTQVPAAIAAAVERLAPEVVLYHSGDVRSAYQVDAWTSVLERAGRTVLVVVRHRSVLQALRPTTLPVVCVVPSSVMVNVGLGGARVAFLVGNGRGNMHLFRRHGLSFVFLGHGDSDKATSATPLARVYAQIWVAGPAASDRYTRAGVQIAPGSIVEIGRPQLADLAVRVRDDGATGRTVLYAPTWEGWGDEQYVASLAEVGVPLIRRLLQEPDVRVVYRPHPLTGTRDRALVRADRAIRALLEAAGGRRVSAPDLASSSGWGSGSGSGSGSGGDDLQACLDDAGPAGAEQARDSSARQAEELWRSGEHLVIEDGWPDLLSCFAHADLLISDISALLSDWLATDRPYVVLNPADVPVETFLAEHPSAGGAAVVGSSLAELDPVLADLRAGVDPRQVIRGRLAASVLGPRPADPLSPLRAALDALLAATPPA